MQPRHKSFLLDRFFLELLLTFPSFLLAWNQELDLHILELQLLRKAQVEESLLWIEGVSWRYFVKSINISVFCVPWFTCCQWARATNGLLAVDLHLWERRCCLCAGGGFACPIPHRVIRPAVSHRPQHLAHLVGVDPADDACIHISHLKQTVYFRVPGTALAALLVALTSK